MRYDRLSRWMTVLCAMALVGGIAYIFYTSGGSYFPAWLTALVVSVGLFASLSVPRYVYVGALSLEVHCVLELTRIEYKQIRSITPVDRRSVRWSFPIPGAGVWGVMGYYGYYFDLRRFRVFKIYARSRCNLVRVVYDSGSVLIVDVGNSEEFMRSLAQHHAIERPLSE